MKTLVVCYSRTGTTRQVGTELAKILGADFEEIVDTRNRAGIMGWLHAGRDASRKQATDIGPVEKNPLGYELLVLGTPVWAWNIAPAIRTYLQKCRGPFKRVAFFCTMGGSGGEKVFAVMEELCGRKPTATIALRTMEVRRNQHAQRLKAFAEQAVAQNPA